VANFLAFTAKDISPDIFALSKLKIATVSKVMLGNSQVASTFITFNNSTLFGPRFNSSNLMKT
jgi:hypothetical protein